MQRLEVNVAVRHLYGSLGVKELIIFVFRLSFVYFYRKTDDRKSQMCHLKHPAYSCTGFGSPKYRTFVI